MVTKDWFQKKKKNGFFKKERIFSINKISIENNMKYQFYVNVLNKYLHETDASIYFYLTYMLG